VEQNRPPRRADLRRIIERNARPFGNHEMRRVVDDASGNPHATGANRFSRLRARQDT
jgi:hypothetical protein